MFEVIVIFCGFCFYRTLTVKKHLEEETKTLKPYLLCQLVKSGCVYSLAHKAMSNGPLGHFGVSNTDSVDLHNLIDLGSGSEAVASRCQSPCALMTSRSQRPNSEFINTESISIQTSM